MIALILSIIKEVLVVLVPWFIERHEKETTQTDVSPSPSALRDRLNDRVRKHEGRSDTAGRDHQSR